MDSHSVECLVCVDASLRTSCGPLDNPPTRRQIRLHLPADLKRVLLTGKEHTRVSPPTEKTNPSTHIFLGEGNASFLGILEHFFEPTLTYQ